MATTIFDTPTRQCCAESRHTVDDVVRHAAHLAHEARVLKTVTADAVEERVVEAAHRIRKNPFRAVGIAFAIGVPVGAFLGWVCSQQQEAL